MSRPVIEYVKLFLMTDGKALKGAEIGVYKGGNAKDILENVFMEKLYLIDPYASYTERGLIKKVTYYEQYYEEAKRNLSDYKHKIEFIKMRSEDAIGSIPNNLDFIYTDGSHKFKDVKKDINMYYHKVRPGGVIGGHDFNSIFVFLAVVQFVFKNRLWKNFTFRKCDWLIRKVERRDENINVAFKGVLDRPSCH